MGSRKVWLESPEAFLYDHLQKKHRARIENVQITGIFLNIKKKKTLLNLIWLTAS